MVASIGSSRIEKHILTFIFVGQVLGTLVVLIAPKEFEVLRVAGAAVCVFASVLSVYTTVLSVYTSMLIWGRLRNSKNEFNTLRQSISMEVLGQGKADRD